MKSIFSLLLLLTALSSGARDIILIENGATLAEGQLLSQILVKKFNLPVELITLRNTNLGCELKSEAIIHLCLRPDGELEIRKMNQYVVRNSLGVFMNQNEGVR